MKRVIAYHAYCKKEYVKMAIISAESAKLHMPDVETVLLTEMDVDGFDRVIKVGPVPVALANFAPLLALPEKYESVIYFDCDSFICAPFYDVFHLIESKQVDMALVPVRHRDRVDTSPIYLGADDVPNAYPVFRGTPTAFQNNARVRTFFALWSQLFHEHQQKYHVQSPWASGCFQRQPSMRVALYHSDLTIAVLPPQYYMVSSLIVHGKVRAFDTSKSKDRRALAKRAKVLNRNPSELRFLSGGQEYSFEDIRAGYV